MRTVMIIDDEPAILSGLEQMLLRNLSGLEIVKCGDGLKAYECLKTRPVDVVISDVMMPEMTGLQLLAHIKENHSVQGVLMISGYDDFHYVRESMRLGASDYLLKPIRQEELIQAVNRLLNEGYEEKRKSKSQSEYSEYSKQEKAEVLYFDLWKILAGIDRGMEDYLKDAAMAVKKQDLERLLRAFDGYLSCAQYNRTEKTFIIRSLSNWLYSLMSELSGMVRVVSKYKLTEYDLTEQIRSAPTLSALRERIRTIWTVYMKEYESSQCRRVIQMDKVKEFVKKHLAEECQITDAAALIDVSPNYLSTIFREYTGMTFREYVREERVKRAIELIGSTNMKLYEIANCVGYQDPAHFSRAFKQVTGFAPQHYMKS